MPTGTIGSAMQPAGASPRTCRRGDALPLAAGIVAFAALLVLTRPYRGIVQDAEIYIGQALASLDPQGLGRDMLFADDEQFRFSLWPALARFFVASFGPDAAAASLVLGALVLWTVACTALAGRLLPRRVLVPGLFAAATLPPLYGGFSIFRYAEAIATPRPLAEALVLAGFACILAGRRLPAVVLLLVAMAVHPIMAAPGVAVAALVLAGSVWRALIVLSAAAIAGLVGAAAGLPVLSRLLVVPDPAWLDALGANAYLFPSRWPLASWCATALPVATLALAIRALDGPARALAGAVAVVGIAGLGIALVLGDGLSSLLVLQVQPWRALWLVELVAALLLPLALVAGWRGEGIDRLAAAALAAAWLVPDGPSAVGLAAAAVLLDAAARQGLARFDARTAGLAWIVVAGLLAVFGAARAAAAIAVWRETPEGAGSRYDIWGLWLLLLAGATIVAARPALRPPAWAGLVGAVVLAGLALALADGRSRLGRVLDAGRPDPALVALLPAEPGPILWLGFEPRRSWVLAGRPNWVGYAQGAPMVFARPLAARWDERMDRLLAAGLGDASDRSPHLAEPGASLHPQAGALAAFCAAPDAPVAIVVPLGGRIVLPAGLPFSPYRLPARDFEPGPGASAAAWTEIDRHAVIACREIAGRQRAGPDLRPSLDAG